MTSSFGVFSSRVRPVVILVLVAFGQLIHSVPAHASLWCKLYAWRIHNNHYQTTYQHSRDQTNAASKEHEPLPKKGVSAVAHLYEVAPERGTIQPCHSLSIRKRLFLLRRNDLDLVFQEVNEFYADDGTLIVTNTQDLTHQLQRSGYYVASDPLPIPQDAPPGRYQLVSKLVLKKKGREAIFLLASETAVYEILPLE